MKKFNDLLGDKLAFGLSTMFCFYAVTILVILPLFWKQPHTAVEWMQYLISVLFQGSSLPLLGYVSRVAGAKQEALLNDTHDKVLAEFAELKDVHAQTTTELEIAGQTHALILEQLAEIRNDMNQLKNGGNKHE